MDIPLVAPLRQTAPQPVVADVAAEVRRQWSGSRFAGRVRRGDRVAVAVGSRGVANLAVMVRATLDFLRDLGAKPFVVAAMGSHGGATAEGQRQLLAEYGVSEAALGAPVKTDMDDGADRREQLGRAGLLGPQRPVGGPRRYDIARQAAHRFPRPVRERRS